MTELEKVKEELRLLTTLVMALFDAYSNSRYMQRLQIDSLMAEWDRRRAELNAIETKGGA